MSCPQGPPRGCLEYPRQMRFRIATFNLHQYLRRWNDRRDLIVQQLVELNADILCLNEVSIPVDSGRWLWHRARDAGLRYAYLQQTKTGGLGDVEGQGILTRFTVLETGFLDFESRGRIAQVARLEFGGQAVDVYLTHLHHIRTEDGLRQYQVQRLLAWVDSRDAPYTRLICGDFNASPEMQSVQLMRQRFQPTQLEPTFTTPLRALVDPDPQFTGEFVGTFVACMDYIWFAPPLKLMDTGRCFNKPSVNDPNLWPSDHVGVWADFELP